MKYRIIVLFILLSPLLAPSSYAQHNVWKTPQPFTDSLTINRNPVIAYVDYFDGPGYYVFWERSEDSLSTGIYAKNFYEPDDPLPILYDTIHHFRNPQVRSSLYYPADSTFYLFYESDITGNKDIYVLWLSANLMLDTINITNDAADDNHLRVNAEGSFVWEKEGQIFFAYIEDIGTPGWHISEPVLISDSNSYNPKITSLGPFYSSGVIAWEQPSDTNVAIYYSQRSYPDTAWSAPALLYDQGYNSNLRFNNDFWIIGVPILVWDNEENGLFQLMAYDFYDEDFFAADLFQDIPFHPSILPIVIPVTDFWSDAFLAFEGMDNDVIDIFVSEYPFMGWGNPYINISNSAAIDRNPQLFAGDFISYYQDFILIWESERNDNCQLWTSVFSMPMGGIGEEENADIDAIAYPNPFREFTSISYKLRGESKVQIKIYDIRGKLIYEEDDPLKKQGEQTFNWKPGNLPAGIYHALIISNEGKASIKLLKQE